MASGDLSGASHLVPILIVLPLLFVARRRPLAGRRVLAVLGAAICALFLLTLRDGHGLMPALVMGAPLLVSGVLFLLGTWG